MKKNKPFRDLSFRSLKKTFEIMRNATFLLFFGILQAHAIDSYSQKTRLSLDFKNTEIITVLDSIEKESEFYFLYNEKLLDTKRTVSIKADNQLIDDVLDNLFEGTDTKYSIIDRKIILAPGNVLTEMNIQQRKITGTVTDENGNPLPGVNVQVEGTSIGTITNVDGKYSIDIQNENSVLIFSFIGYISQRVTPAGQATINISLVPTLTSLEEVVVVGYSVQKKMDITGSVAVVDVNELKKVPASNLGQQLQGKAAGVIVGTTGGPGTSTMVRIRGIGTVNNNGPLYVIDGVSTRNQDLNSINPNDIESVQVLKDASAASVYGAQASNGVIIITTKKGVLGHPKVNYDAYFAVSLPPASYDLLNTTDRIALEWKAKANAYSIRGVSTLPSHAQFGTGTTPVYPNYIIPTASAGPFTVDDWTETNRITEFNRNGEGDDWYRASVQNAPIQSHQITISGANESAKYLLGVNYYDEDGILNYNYYKRYSARMNTEYNIRKWLKVGENLIVTFSNSNVAATQGEGNVFAMSLRLNPWIPIYDIKGEFAGTRAAGAGNGASPVANLYRAKDNYRNYFRTFGNVFAEATIIPGLKFKSNVGLDQGRSYYYSMTKKAPEQAEGLTYNTLSEGSGFSLGIQWTNTLNFEKTFNDIHSVNFLLGSEYILNGLGRSMSASRRNYLFEDNVNTWILANGERENMDNNSTWNGKVAMFGIFSRIDYVYDNRYLLTGTIRRDGSSRFSEANRYGIFPALSLGWRISNEKFMENINWLSDLKLRAGYGVTGNSEIPRANNWATEYGTDPGHTNYDFTAAQGSAQQGFMLMTYGNAETKWESTQMINIGMDATLFNGILDGSIEYYIKNTSDMLVLDSYSALAGEATAPYVNLGKMRNVGWDITLNHRYNIGKVGYNVGLTISTYKNEVVKLNQAEGTRFWGGGDSRLGYLTMTELGSPISVFYGYNIIGFYESEEDVLNYKGTTGTREGQTVLPLGVGSDAALNPTLWVGKWKYEDVNGDGFINASDQKVIGNPHPDFTGSANLGLTYMNFDLSASLYFSVGNDIFNYAKWWTDFWSYEGNRSTTMRDKSWEPGKTDAVLPILDYQDAVSNKNPNSYYVENGSFLRMQMLSLGYTFPKNLISKAGIENLRIYLQGTNLLTFTKYSGLDPDVTNQIMGDSGDLTKGVDFFHWPVSKQFLFGINVSF
jgi:TonB-linked SusC/RagA family outer membrane protein